VRSLPDRRWLLLGGIGATLLVALIVGVLAVTMFGQSGPEDTANQLCTDLKAQDYTSAFNLLSATLRGKTTAPQFAAVGQSADRVYGKVKDCGISSMVNVQGDQAMLTMSITRNTTTTGQVALVKEDGGWKVNQVQGNLQIV
jgi:hypothetical protein